jgi:hypothetical protein
MSEEYVGYKGKGGRSETFTDEQFAEAIKGSRGIMAVVARKVGCVHATATRRIEKNPELKEAFETERAEVLDRAEEVVFDAIEDDDVSTARWLLATLGKKRGYSQKQHVESKGNIKLVYADDWDEHGVDGKTSETS